jgi:hypothetical protein
LLAIGRLTPTSDDRGAIRREIALSGSISPAPDFFAPQLPYAPAGAGDLALDDFIVSMFGAAPWRPEACAADDAKEIDRASAIQRCACRTCKRRRARLWM